MYNNDIICVILLRLNYGERFSLVIIYPINESNLLGNSIYSFFDQLLTGVDLAIKGRLV